MKVRTSYFYQIRNFKKNMIPISTALWDPKWFHDNQGPYYIYQDKRGILNGLRLEAIISKARECECTCPCENRDSANCKFLKSYREQLEKVDFDKMWTDIQHFAIEYQKDEGFEEEPIVVLIVYETPKNYCSERQSLIDYFNSHGVECKELDYPIQPLVKAKDEPFDF